MFIISNERCKRQWAEGIKHIKGTLFIKKKAESYLSLYRANVFEEIESESISHSLKEAGEVISDRLLIAMVLKELPPNFKPFAMVITQKKKTSTFS